MGKGRLSNRRLSRLDLRPRTLALRLRARRLLRLQARRRGAPGRWYLPSLPPPLPLPPRADASPAPAPRYPWGHRAASGGSPPPPCSSGSAYARTRRGSSRHGRPLRSWPSLPSLSLCPRPRSMPYDEPWRISREGLFPEEDQKANCASEITVLPSQEERNRASPHPLGSSGGSTDSGAWFPRDRRKSRARPGSVVPAWDLSGALSPTSSASPARARDSPCPPYRSRP